MKRTKKQIKKDRWWKHIKWWLKPPFFINLKQDENWNPDEWRNAFERYQSNGSKALSEDELNGIQPLIAAQIQKEACLSSHACEAMEFWAAGQGWSIPIWDSLKRGGYDRLTRLALLRMRRAMENDVIAFFKSHPGIPEAIKERNFLQYGS